MTAPPRPGTIDDLRETIAPFAAFFAGPIWARNGEPGMANFAVGNPQDMPLPGYVDALRAKIEPQSPDWFAYKLSEPRSQAVIAADLTARTGLPWDPADVAMTNGGFGALAVAFRAMIEPGDEVVFPTPPWFFYEILIRAPGGTAVRVPLAPPAFDLDVDAIAAAITPRTRAVLVNTPHNPSGRVFPIDDLRRLAEVLVEASARIGHRIYLVSDEPYNRILFDGRVFHSPAEVYPDTITTYSFGKTLLAPGMRIGYLTVPPTMPGREAFRDRVFVAQIAQGYAFPNALLQHAIEDLDRLSIDVAALERRRNRLVPALRDLGYETTFPEGTFYVMARSPIDDDVAFAELLAEESVLVLPGRIVEVPGWFRISLTATDEMVERGLEGFARARERALAVAAP
ncbi:MAG: aminotransferase class I/II-fold pyridoxal phosphate-dependent enzyme [Chloroflexota bacterium]